MKVWKLAFLLLWRTLRGDGGYDAYVAIEPGEVLSEDVALAVGRHNWAVRSVSWTDRRDRFLCISGEAEVPA